jgi:hypothetical protein
MSLTDMEDRLSRSLAGRADALVDLGGLEARQAVAHRAATLRQRRRAARALVGATMLLALVATVAAGVAKLGDDDPASVSTAEVTGEELPSVPAELPGFTVEGLAPTTGEKAWYDPPPDVTVDKQDPVTGDLFSQRRTVQAFRRPGDHASPNVLVTYGATIRPAEGTSVTLVGGSGGRLDTGNPQAPVLSWQPHGGTAIASAQAWGLAPEELVSLVDGLTLRSDGTGFDADELPVGIVEDPVEPPEDPDQVWSAYSVLDLTDDRDDVPGPVHITVVRSDEADFELALGRRLAVADSVEQISVLGRPAVLVHYRDEEKWSVQWRHDTADRVEVRIADRDRATVGDVLSSLREIDEETFADLLHEAGRDPRNSNTPSTPMD